MSENVSKMAAEWIDFPKSTLNLLQLEYLREINHPGL